LKFVCVRIAIGQFELEKTPSFFVWGRTSFCGTELKKHKKAFPDIAKCLGPNGIDNTQTHRLTLQIFLGQME